MGAAAIPLVAFGASALVKTVFQERAATKQDEALVGRQNQELLAANRREVQQIKRFESIVSAQNALAAAKGIAPSSGSFNAIQQSTFDDFADDLDADNLNFFFREQAISQQRHNNRDQFFSGVISSFFDIATQGRNMSFGSQSSSFDDRSPLSSLNMSF